MNNSNQITTGSIYDVTTYSDKDIFNILDLNNPSDRELEAKILTMVNKYTRMKGTLSADMLAKFFIDIYNRFFEMPEQDSESEYYTDYDTDNDSVNSDSRNSLREGFQDSYDNTMNLQQGMSYDKNDMTQTYNFTNLNGNVQTNDACGNDLGKYQINSQPRTIETYNNIKRVGTLDITKNGRGDNPTQLTKPIDYTNDYINPLLKQTIKRVISIDSQYRDNKQSASTEFTFNLSEPLRDVVSLKLYSVQIPYTWYTINSSFGGNFFYIKGDAAGINNGTHDYKIEIPSGNYTSTSLIDKIQNSISELRVFAPHVDFGTTSILYNSSTVQTTLTIDIKEVFGESNYYIEFPNWSSPLDDISNKNTLAGYMGYNTTKYDCFTIYSGRVISPGQTKNNVENTIRIDGSNDTISIVKYVPVNIGDEYDPSASLIQYHDSSDSIVITHAEYNIYTLLDEINTKLNENPSFEHEYTKIQTIDTDSSSNVQDAGNSYIKLDIKFKREVIRNKENFKTAIIFPNDNTWNNLLGFTDVKYETSHIQSETPIPQTKYIITNDINLGTTGLKFKCDVSGYIDPINDIVIDLSASSTIGYTLYEYVDEINRAITSYSDYNSNKSVAGTKIEITPENYLKLTPNVTMTFTNKDYTIQFEGDNLPKLLCGSPNIDGNYNYNLNDTNSWTQSFDITAGNPVINQTDIIRIIPKFPYTDSDYVPQTFILQLYTKDDLHQTIVSVTELESYINRQISNYRDIEDKNPFTDGSLRTRLTKIDDYSYTFTVDIYKSFTTEDYTLSLYGNVLNGIDNGRINPWVNYLEFIGTDNNDNLPYEEIYNFKQNATSLYGVGTSGILNNKTIINGSIVLNATNNYFYIKSYNIDGLTLNGAGLYDMKITIPLDGVSNLYTVEDIYAITNMQFDSCFNGIAAGSRLTKNSNGNTVFKMNINKVFRTNDYRLVFYDPYSFVSCYTGATRRGSQSIQNATWDTTVGWVLGFREQIIYYLNEYMNTNDNIPGVNPVCVITGDTTVSTNLYNYFLIVLDDYTQNHLNDGLVTITTQETAIDVGPYKYVCDPYATNGGGALIAVPADIEDYTKISQRELYTFNQKIQSNKVKEKSYSKGPFVKDIFGIIPIKTSGLLPGGTYVEFGGTLQNQERMYFGPVNIHRMTIRLLNDRGDLVDLNNANWSFSLVCEQLYKKTTL